MASSAPDSHSAAVGTLPSPTPCGISEADMIIPVSMPEKELLGNNDVAEEFFKKLQEKDIEIELETLHTDRIVIVRGDLRIAKECLASVICSESVDFTATDEPETVSKLHSLRERYTTQFALEISEGGRAQVAFLTGIKKEVLLVLEDLKYAKKLFPLTRELNQYLQSYEHSFTTKLNSNFHPPVKLRIVVGPSKEPHLELVCTRVQLAKVEADLMKRLTLLCSREVEVGRSRASYLQSSEGEEKMKEIGNKHHCTMSMETHDRCMLLAMRSPKGHQMKIYEGNIALSECPMIVLPLPGDQTEWKHPYHSILQRGGLNTDPKQYLKFVGPPPKDIFSPRPCQDIALGQIVIIMYVPPRSDGSFQDTLSMALTETLKFARHETRPSIAIPLKLCTDMDFAVIRQMMTAVCKCYDDNDLPGVVHFYLDARVSLPGDISAVFQERGWTTESSTDTEELIFDQRVKVVIGDIMNVEGDVVVNSTDPGLKHSFGQVSKVFLRHLGKPLLEQCAERYPGGIDQHIVAVTDAFDLTQFKNIFHVALPTEPWNIQKKKELLQALRTRVEACLCLASLKGFSSIVFPALATGNLSYPANLEAKTVLEATRTFFIRMPYSPLKKVIIVAYLENPAVAIVSKAEEAVQRYSLHLSADPDNVEKRYEVRKTLVQVIKADALTRRCTAQLLICASQPSMGKIEDYQKKKDTSCKLKAVDKGSVKNEIRDTLKETSAASVQINMQTFDPACSDHAEGVIGGIEKSGNQKVLIILIVEPSTEGFLRLCRKLSRSRSFDLVTSHERCRRSDPTTPAFVYVYGSKEKTKEAIKEVSVVKVPQQYVQAAECHLHHSFLERAHYSQATTISRSRWSMSESRRLSRYMDSTTGGSTQRREPVEVVIPKQQLQDQGIEILGLMEAMESAQVTLQVKDGMVRFRSKLQNAQELNTLVQSTIAGRRPSAQPATLRAGIPEESGLFQSLGSFDIPSAIRIQQTTASSTFDKNLDLERSSSGESGPDPPSTVDSSFVLLGSPGDMGDGSSLGSPGPTEPLSQSSQVPGKGDASGQGQGSGNSEDGDGQAGDSTAVKSIRVQERQFMTKKGLRVTVCVGRITAVQADAVVNAADEKLTLEGDLASAIATAAGPSLQAECNQYISQHGQLKVTEVVATTGGDLPCQHVLHAVGPCWKDCTDKLLCEQHLTNTIINCLRKADSLGLTSVAFSSASSGSFGVPHQMRVDSYLGALLTFDEQRGGNTGLKEIQFVDDIGDMASILQEAFAAHWGTA